MILASPRRMSTTRTGSKPSPRKPRGNAKSRTGAKSRSATGAKRTAAGARSSSGNTKSAKTPNPRKRAATASRGNRWSARVMRESDALDLTPGVFSQSDPKKIARSLKRSAERSTRRKSDPFRSSMSMLTFFVNRAGSKLGARQKRVLERAKDELRSLFGRTVRAS